MNKKRLISRVAEATGLPREKIEVSVALIFATITNSLKPGNDVRVARFGAFVLQRRAPKRGRNPKTGAPLFIPAGYRTKFKPGKRLVERLNGQE